MDCDLTPLSCRLDRLIEVMSTGVPSPSDVVAWILTLISIAASTFIGIVAWKTSQKATAIAATALAAEDRRENEAYNASLNGALSAFFSAVAEYVTRLNIWLHDVGALEESAPGVAPGELEYPMKPGAAAVTLAVEAARLLTRGDDRDTLARIASHWKAIRKLPERSKERALARLVSGIRQWRTEAWTRPGFHSFLTDELARLK